MSNNTLSSRYATVNHNVTISIVTGDPIMTPDTADILIDGRTASTVNVINSTAFTASTVITSTSQQGLLSIDVTVADQAGNSARFTQEALTSSNVIIDTNSTCIRTKTVHF